MLSSSLTVPLMLLTVSLLLVVLFVLLLLLLSLRIRWAFSPQNAKDLSRLNPCRTQLLNGGCMGALSTCRRRSFWGGDSRAGGSSVDLWRSFDCLTTCTPTAALG